MKVPNNCLLSFAVLLALVPASTQCAQQAKVKYEYDQLCKHYDAQARQEGTFATPRTVKLKAHVLDNGCTRTAVLTNEDGCAERQKRRDEMHKEFDALGRAKRDKERLLGTTTKTALLSGGGLAATLFTAIKMLQHRIPERAARVSPLAEMLVMAVPSLACALCMQQLWTAMVLKVALPWEIKQLEAAQADVKNAIDGIIADFVLRPKFKDTLTPEAAAAAQAAMKAAAQEAVNTAAQEEAKKKAEAEEAAKAAQDAAEQAKAQAAAQAQQQQQQQTQQQGEVRPAPEMPAADAIPANETPEQKEARLKAGQNQQGSDAPASHETNIGGRRTVHAAVKPKQK